MKRLQQCLTQTGGTVVLVALLGTTPAVAAPRTLVLPISMFKE
jgi:hypothetical protein